MALDPKNLDKYLENLKAAETYSKEVNASFSNWESAAKNIKNISNEIKNKQKLIAELTERQVGASIEEKKILQDQVNFEKEKLKQGQEQLKLLRKQASVTKTLFNEAKKAAKGLSSQLWSVVEAFSKADGAARRVSVQMGLGTARMGQFERVAANSAEQLALMGMEAGTASEMMGSFADETGRQVILGKKVVVEMGALAQRTGLAHGEMAGLVGQMEGFGLGASSSVKMVSDIADEADKMGLNTSKVIKKVQKNLKLINKLSFKGGVKGMMKMAAYSEKYKLSMEEVAGFADKVFRPEGAIDAAANLQVLGGSLAKMGDPFQLLYKARNAPKELAESITKAAVASAVFNEKTKEFDVSAYELDRLKEASEATGLSMDMLVATAKQTAKMNMFEDALKVGGDDKEFLSGIAEMKDGKAQIAIGVDADGEKKYEELKNMSKSDQMFYADKLKKEKESNEEAAMRAQGTLELLKNMMNSLLAKLYPLLLDMDKVLRPIIMSAFNFMKNSVMPLVMKALNFLGPKGIIASIFLFKAAQWIMRGRMLGIGFNMTAGKGGLFKKLGGLFKGKQSAVTSATGPLTKSGKPDMRFKANKGLGGAGKGAAGTQAMGQSAGGQSANFLKGAVGLLAIAAALFVFAKALQEFEKLQNGWGTLVLAASSLIVLAGALKIMQPILNSFGTSAWPGIAAMAALSVSVLALGFATQLFAQGGLVGTLLMVGALFALAGAVTLFGGLSLSGIGWAGVALILAMGAAMLMIGYSVKLAAEGISVLVDSFTNLFTSISMENIAPMLLLGPAFIGIAAGLIVLSVALAAFGLAWLVGGWAFEEMSDSIAALGDVDLSGLGNAVQAINNVNMEKIEALRDLASSLSLSGLFSGGGIKIEFGGIDVSGDIELKGGGETAKIVMEEPYLTQLKDLIWETTASGQNGGIR
jgi:hypothetical protein